MASGSSVHRKAVEICGSAQVLDLDPERPGPPRPPLTVFAIAAAGAAADEVIILVIDEQIEIAAAVPGDACLGQLPAVEHDSIGVGGPSLDGVVMGPGLPLSGGGTHPCGLFDQQVCDLLTLGEIAGFDEHRVDGYRLARFLCA